MPDIEGGQYLVAHWNDCGLFGTSMNGLEPLTWQEIQAYSEQGGGYLDNWESKQIRQMSQAYVGFRSQAEKINCPAPYRSPMTDEDRAQNAKEIKAQMSDLKNL